MDANKEIIESLSWYGCVIVDTEDSPILFPLSRMGYIMDGAEISDEDGSYKSLGKDRLSVVKCYFMKDGTPISPEQASEDYNYQGLGFNIVDLSSISVNGIEGGLDNLYDLYIEDPNEFKSMLEYCLGNFLEEELPDKKYLGFAILTEESDGPCLYAMDKMGRIYPGFFYKAQDKLAELMEDERAVVMELQFMDGTFPIPLNEAHDRMDLEPENIFISARNLGHIELREEMGFTSWDKAIDEDEISTMNTLRMAMYALQQQDDDLQKQAQEEPQQQDQE